MRNTHSRSRNMARKLKIMENEKHSLDDLKNDEITKKRERIQHVFVVIQGNGAFRSAYGIDVPAC